MTREEEINNEATNYGYCVVAGCPERVYLSKGFQTGALWADENPNLSSLWHDGGEEPKENTDILFFTEKGKVHKVSKIDDWFYDWINENGGIKRWAYINDLLPKNRE